MPEKHVSGLNVFHLVIGSTKPVFMEVHQNDSKPYPNRIRIEPHRDRSKPNPNRISPKPNPDQPNPNHNRIQSNQIHTESENRIRIESVPFLNRSSASFLSDVWQPAPAFNLCELHIDELLFYFLAKRCQSLARWQFQTMDYVPQVTTNLPNQRNVSGSVERIPPEVYVERFLLQHPSQTDFLTSLTENKPDISIFCFGLLIPETNVLEFQDRFFRFQTDLMLILCASARISAPLCVCACVCV